MSECITHLQYEAIRFLRAGFRLDLAVFSLWYFTQSNHSGKNLFDLVKERFKIISPTAFTHQFAEYLQCTQHLSEHKEWKTKKICPSCLVAHSLVSKGGMETSTLHFKKWELTLIEHLLCHRSCVGIHFNGFLKSMGFVVQQI